MTREYQTDSGLFVNETGTRQAQTDGGLFVNETVTVGGNGGNGGNGGSGVPITEMTFINGAGVDFATGRIVANIASGVPADADMSHSIGLLYDNDPSPNALQLNDTDVVIPAVNEWIHSDFNGSSSLTLATYVPEVNTWARARQDAADNNYDSNVVDSILPNLAFTDTQLNGSGGMQALIAATSASKDSILQITPVTAFSSSDYQIEIKVAVPTYASAQLNAALYLNLYLRTSSATGGAFYANTIETSFVIQTHVPTTQWTTFYSNAFRYWDFTGTFDPLDGAIRYDPYIFNLGSAAQTITVNVTVNGRHMEARLNGALVGEWTWDGSKFDSGGLVLSFEYLNQTSRTQSDFVIDSIIAGDIPTSTSVDVTSYGLGGILRDGYGQLIVTFTEPAGTPIFNNGLWVTPDTGYTVATTTDPIVSYSHGWPVSAKGAVCVVLV